MTIIFNLRIYACTESEHVNDHVDNNLDLFIMFFFQLKSVDIVKINKYLVTLRFHYDNY